MTDSNTADGAAGRDPLAERVFLDRTTHLARLAVASWPKLVEQRLEVGQTMYGDAWAERSTADLIVEADAEAVDLAAWSTLAVQSIDTDPDTTLTVGEMLAHAAGAAAEAHAYLIAAVVALRKASR
jgi:hypothetical protein